MHTESPLLKLSFRSFWAGILLSPSGHVQLCSFLKDNTYRGSFSEAQLPVLSQQPSYYPLAVTCLPSSAPTIVVPHTSNHKDELGIVGYLRTSIPNFNILARPLYEASTGPLTEPLDPMKSVIPVSRLTGALQ